MQNQNLNAISNVAKTVGVLIIVSSFFNVDNQTAVNRRYVGGGIIVGAYIVQVLLTKK
jgi:hypothetical protein